MMNQFSYINDRTEETIRAILAKEKEEKEKYETFDLHLYYTERILNKKVAIC